MPDLLKELDQLMKIDDWNATHHLRFEQIDCRFTNELLSAENKCKHPHHDEWHPTLHHSYLIYTYWKSHVSSTLTRNIAHRTLDRIRAQLQIQTIDVFQNNPNRPAFYQLKVAKSNLRDQRQLACQQRDQHLTFRQEVLVLEGK
jgi:hypothetical protein